MPLVTRTSTQGNLFKQATEPTQWVNADLWSDSDSTPRSLFINNDGTALELGVFSEGDGQLTNSQTTSGLPQNIALNETWGNGSEAVTIVNSTNKVCLCACAYTASAIGAGTTSCSIREDTTVLASSTQAYGDDNGAMVIVMHVEDDVTDTTTFNSLEGGGTGGGSVLAFQVFE